MIRYYTEKEIPQGSELWHEVRNGLITGTTAYDLLTGLTIDECLTKKESDTFTGNYYTKRGTLLEDEAKEIYSELYEKVTNFGFVINDKYPKTGYSPDGIVCKDEVPAYLIECKCLTPERHLSVYQSLDAHYYAQIQLGLLITELPYCDLILYNPDIEETELSFLTRRIYPDQKIHKRLKELLNNPKEITSDEMAIALAKNIEELELALNSNEQFKAFLKATQELDAMKTAFKDYLKQHMIEQDIKQLTSPNGKDDWQATLSKAHTVTCNDMSEVEDDFIIEEEITDAIIRDGKAYRKVPNLKAVQELDKIGATMPSGFEVKITPRFSLKMGGKPLR